MTTDPRALIAEGRKHDEAMTAAPWTECCSWQDESHPCRLIWGAVDAETIGSLVLEEGRPPKADVAGIAWIRTNLAAMLDGYASALDEIERLKADIVMYDEQHAAIMDGTFAVGDGTAQREIERLRARNLELEHTAGRVEGMEVGAEALQAKVAELERLLKATLTEA